MKIEIVLILLSMSLLLFGCSNQEVQPIANTYNITITDNSQSIVGDNVKAQTTSKTDARANIKPEIKASAENTTKNGMWIFWSSIVICFIISGYFIWRKFNR